MEEVKHQLLDKINYPTDFKQLNEEELIQLSSELRKFIIETLSKTPGHFGASLGVVELTVALHHVFDTPTDKIVWDVGHQAYGHKILTGRKDRFNTLRKLNGISGFPNIFESEYDAFTVGHSSTSISAALGMSISSKLQGKNNNVIAVIGDGSMTAGLAFEGINNAAVSKSNILIILNDNDMAIDPNVGALSKYFTRFTASKRYNKLKKEVWDSLGKLSKLGDRTREFVRKIDTGIKSSLIQESTYFEGMGLRYFGPIDGHCMHDLIEVLQDLKEIDGPKLLHIKTVKGKGYKFAEENQTKWHATSAAFDIETGQVINTGNEKPKPPKFQDVFGKTIIELAKQNEKIVGITPAMPSGCSLNMMMKEMPERAFDVGIAEQHAVTFSAGLAVDGMIPFCNIYSTFMQRAYDQVIHDVALQNLHVIFCLDRGGLVGDDGATHHGAYDLSYMRSVPNMVVASPFDEIELRNLMYTAQLEKNKFPFTIRYPRGRGSNIDWQKDFSEIIIGKGRIITKGDDIAILTIGAIGSEIVKSIELLKNEHISAAHYDMRFVKPLDEELLHQIFSKFKHIITVEDNSIIGGLGTAVVEFMNANNYNSEIKILGIPDEFIEQGTQQELYKICGFDYLSVSKTAKKMLVIQK
ncbi:MAG: 1-deoxy-D-xylulose-5-phosphate synthase [Bacteroidales bacterium]|nr:1-deoxy-D-xylulose-5-phosphate synthase [Bacteroidales bacterium]